MFPPPEHVFADAPALATPIITAGGRLNDSLSVVAPYFITDAAAHDDEQAADQDAASDETHPPVATAAPGGDARETPTPPKAKARAPRRKHAVSDTNQGCLFPLLEADPETPPS